MAKVLLVDDDAPHTRIMRRRLEHSGYAVEVSNRSYGVLNLIAQSRPDVVLMDMNMPGLSGPELLALVRQDAELSATRVIFYSGVAEAELRARSAEAGADGFVQKMTPYATLLQVLQAA